MIKITDFESDILYVIKKWQKRYMNSPTIPELAQELECTRERIRKAVEQLTEKGYLEMAYSPVSNRVLIVVLFWE